MASGEILRLEGIDKAFGDAQVLRGLSLCVKPHEFLTLLGPSGCGKTTTLRIIAGLTRADRGRVLIGERVVTDVPPEKRPVNTVFQNYALFPHMSVEKNISYGLRIRGVDRETQRARVKELLELIELAGYEKRMPSQLSGGQRQRVAIARALATEPTLLLLDEPLGALDLQLRRQMQLELKRLQTRLGIAFVYITHDQEEALTMSDRIGILNGGRLEQLGTPEDVYERPETLFSARFIGESLLLPGKVISGRSGAYRVSLAGGEALSADPRVYTAGESVWVCVRSERLRLTREPVPGFTLKGLVCSHHYTGAMVRSTLALPQAGEVMAMSAQAVSELPGEGSEAFLSWLPRHAALVPGGSAT